LAATPTALPSVNSLKPREFQRTILSTRPRREPFAKHAYSPIDSEVRRRLAYELIPPIIARLEEFDAIVLADYEKGTLPEELLKAAIGCAKASAIPVIVDPKKRDFSAYSDATVVTPNRRELERAVDRPLDSLAEVKRAAEQTRRRFNFDQLLCTCGSDGFVLASADQVIHLPTESVEVADVTGAGDTVVATLAVEIAARRAMDDACRWALMAAAIAVKHSRVHVVTRYELEQASLRKSSKILPRPLLPTWVANNRRYGHRIVFTNGCFDILHAGHLSYLEQAKERGDVLIVGLNSDESVRRLKGPSRPRVHQDHRAALLAGLACIDCVVIFEEDTPEALLELIRPECLVKGGDYVPSQIVGAKFVREYGGEVIVVRLVQGLSSTAILRE